MEMVLPWRRPSCGVYQFVYFYSSSASCVVNGSVPRRYVDGALAVCRAHLSVQVQFVKLRLRAQSWLQLWKFISNVL